MTRLVLGSASPARLRTLRRAGIEPIVQPSAVDEDAVVAQAISTYGPLEPADVALLLARAKAEDVAANLSVAPEEVVVLGCDSILELAGEVHGKPADADQARARWQQMRNATGIVHTGHWLIDVRPDGTGATLGAAAATTVHFGDPTEVELEAYLATGEPLAVAGAFTTDGRGGAFIRGIEGDHHNVVGVSLPTLRDLMAQSAILWTDLWST
jgi:septum formation protein